MWKRIKNLRHFFYAWWGGVLYRHPSDELLVIGVTGTSGKSSTIHFLRQVLEAGGLKVGSLSTVDFYIAGEEKLNDQKMTMLGKMQIQKYLREMVDKKCDVAIIEMTSEGALQHRNKFINVDIMALTNLYPEHIESHGSFENYKKAKLSIFRYISRLKRKLITRIRGFYADDANHADNPIKKIVIVNGGSEYADEFLQFNFDEKIKFQPNEFSKRNYACVAAIARSLKIPEDVIQNTLASVKGVPGRIEYIPEAEAHGFKVIVDYAFEPVAMGALYEEVALLKPKKIIHVFGSTGGGRDKARRFTVGELVGGKADVCIVTDEDPYDDDPMEIINDVAAAVKKALRQAQGKAQEGENLFKIVDRREAIKKAIEMAGEGDVILITGKGSEQKMCAAGGKMIDWDDRAVVWQILNDTKSEILNKS